MKEGKGAKLLATILPSKPGEANPEAKLLSSRKIMIALALLDGQGQFHGKSISKAAFRADLTNVDGDWILNEEWQAALSLFAAQATESKDEKALEKLQKHPEHCPRYKRTDYRKQQVERFPYLIFFLELPDSFWVSAIGHGARRPQYWKSRKPEGNQ